MILVESNLKNNESKQRCQAVPKDESLSGAYGLFRSGTLGLVEISSKLPPRGASPETSFFTLRGKILG